MEEFGTQISGDEGAELGVFSHTADLISSEWS